MFFWHVLKFPLIYVHRALLLWSLLFSYTRAYIIRTLLLLPEYSVSLRRHGPNPLLTMVWEGASHICVTCLLRGLGSSRLLTHLIALQVYQCCGNDTERHWIPKSSLLHWAEITVILPYPHGDLIWRKCVFGGSVCSISNDLYYFVRIFVINILVIHFCFHLFSVTTYILM